jgi:prepilin-type N-terminal cleavage/methylation domain-containing protein
MIASRRGFSLIETVITVLIGTILVSIASPSFGGARGRLSVTGARTAFSSLHARARAQAVERGTTVNILVYTVGDSVTLEVGGEILETVRFGGEMHVDIRASREVLRQCMTPRGFADIDCNSFSGAPKITFWQNADSASLTMLPLGQLLF